jgi:hypothetical protein
MSRSRVRVRRGANWLAPAPRTVLLDCDTGGVGYYPVGWLVLSGPDGLFNVPRPAVALEEEVTPLTIWIAVLALEEKEAVTASISTPYGIPIDLPQTATHSPSRRVPRHIFAGRPSRARSASRSASARS